MVFNFPYFVDQILAHFYMSHVMRKPVYFICSLFSALVVRCLDSIIPIVVKSKISTLASFFRFVSYLVVNPEDMAHIIKAVFLTLCMLKTVI